MGWGALPPFFTNLHKASPAEKLFHLDETRRICLSISKTIRKTGLLYGDEKVPSFFVMLRKRIHGFSERNGHSLGSGIG